MNDNDTGTGPIEIDKVRASKAGHAFQLGPHVQLLNSCRRRPTLPLSRLRVSMSETNRAWELVRSRLPISSGTTAPPMLPGRIESRSFSSNTRSQAPTRQCELLTWHQLLPSLPRPMPSFGRCMGMIMFSPWSGMNLLRTGPSTRTKGRRSQRCRGHPRSR